MVGKKLATKILKEMQNNVTASEDPRNRVVTKVYLEPNEKYDTIKVYVDSNVDDFAEDEHKFLFETSNLDLDPEKILSTKETEYSLVNKYYISSVDELIRSLERLYSMENPAVSKEENGVFFDIIEPLANYIEGMACSELINSDGSCNWFNIDKVMKAGYEVYAGDKDSFGWLVGCIQKEGSDHILTYG